MTKMLFIDIETAPILGHVWSLWKQNVGLNQIKEDWYIMSFCAKWAGENEIIYEDGRDTPEDDYSMLLTLHKLLDQADYVVAHNGDRFDIKKIKARMILNGISPPSPFKSIVITTKTFGPECEACILSVVQLLGRAKACL